MLSNKLLDFAAKRTRKVWGVGFRCEKNQKGVGCWVSLRKEPERCGVLGFAKNAQPNLQTTPTIQLIFSPLTKFIPNTNIQIKTASTNT